VVERDEFVVGGGNTQDRLKIARPHSQSAGQESAFVRGLSRIHFVHRETCSNGLPDRAVGIASMRQTPAHAWFSNFTLRWAHAIACFFHNHCVHDFHAIWSRSHATGHDSDHSGISRRRPDSR